jgi:hypothetical protein
MIISDELLTEFKARMRITHSTEDDNLRRILSHSAEDLLQKTGPFDLEANERARELTLERSRYAYNDALEYFDQNFLSSITSLGLSLALEQIVLEEPTTDATV